MRGFVTFGYPVSIRPLLTSSVNRAKVGIPQRNAVYLTHPFHRSACRRKRQGTSKGHHWGPSMQTRSIAEQRAAMPDDVRARLDAITAQAEADKRAGGPWRLYIPRPGSSRLWLHWSFPTEAAARERLATMYPHIRQLAEIRRED